MTGPSDSDDDKCPVCGGPPPGDARHEAAINPDLVRALEARCPGTGDVFDGDTPDDGQKIPVIFTYWCRSQDGPWLAVKQDFDTMAEAARDLAFEIRALKGGYNPWKIGDDLRGAFQRAVRRLQKSAHTIPVVREADRKHLEVLLRLECPPAFDPKWLPWEQDLENWALACRRVAAEASRLIEIAVAARKSKSGVAKKGRLPEVGLNKFVELSSRGGASVDEMASHVRLWRPGLTHKQLTDFVDDKRYSLLRRPKKPSK
jgi:hypothetical protein